MQNKKKIKIPPKKGRGQTLGSLQANSQKKIPSRVLYLFPDGTFWCEFPNGTRALAEGCPWSISKIRFKGAKASMLQLQYKSGGYGCRGLRKNAKGNRSERNGTTSDGQKRNGRRDGTLP